MKNILHVKAPGNWVNDPNGMIYYKGQYHLFYQHFPYAPRWGTMHWGHAVSPDLIHWEHVGVALFPSLSEDQNGCFSGSAVEENGVMHLFYTGVHYNQVNPKDIHQCLDQDFTSAQLHLTSKDGMHFDQFIADTAECCWNGESYPLNGNAFLQIGSAVLRRHLISFQKL